MANHLGYKVETLPVLKLTSWGQLLIQQILGLCHRKKIKQRLATWRSRLLSKVEMTQLIKFVLNNLPIYYLSIFKIPTTVANKIVSIQKKFIWGGVSIITNCLVLPGKTLRHQKVWIALV